MDVYSPAMRVNRIRYENKDVTGKFEPVFSISQGAYTVTGSSTEVVASYSPNGLTIYGDGIEYAGSRFYKEGTEVTVSKDITVGDEDIDISSDYDPFDVNRDGKVDVNDVNALINQIIN